MQSVKLNFLEHSGPLQACKGTALIVYIFRSQWLRDLRRRSAAASLLRSWVRIPPGTWMFVCCECCVLSGRGLCVDLIIRPEKSYQLWCVVVCYLETSSMRRPWPALGRSAPEKEYIYVYTHTYTHTKLCYIIWHWVLSIYKPLHIFKLQSNMYGKFQGNMTRSWSKWTVSAP